MIIIPAIDIKDGKVVRLSQGRFQEITIYSSDPVAFAKKWETAGASLIHIVDLDGAEKGEMKNFDAIAKISKAVKVPLEVGGGIRKRDDILRVLGQGISRVVLGTRVVEDRAFLKEILKDWKERIVVSLDCSHGIVTQKGWTSVSNLKATDFAKELQDMGLTQLIYTDIARDGTLRGPNLTSIKEILDSVTIPVIASGGVSNLEDIKSLKKLGSHLWGAIVGKALYEGNFELKDAISLCSQKE
ncbi:MAG: 1-(5-phosphoribosyl)-5-[(5-phosphoribosylamino)methylideneamino]imidazole-4-carboxamide isomerase [Candidatus Omnitrophota bacterium]